MSQTPRRALVVDPDPEARRQITEALESHGFTCAVAQDGVKALEWVMAAPFHLVVTEASLPRLDGVELLARLRDMSLAAGIALLVISDDPSVAERASNLEANAFLRKPFTTEDVAAAARDVLGLGDATDATTLDALAASDSHKRLHPVHTETHAPPEQLESVFGGIRPAEICLLLHVGRRSARLTFHPSNKSYQRGLVLVLHGEILSALILDQDDQVIVEGEPALAEIFQWPQGRFELLTGPDLSSDLPINVTRLTPKAIKEAQRAELAHEDPQDLGPFVIRETLERRPYATIHRVRHTDDPSYPATRLILESESHPDLNRRDFPALQTLQIRGIAALHSWGELPDGTRYVETDYPRGSSLQTLVRAEGPIEPVRALEIFEQISRSLGTLHAAGFCHGSLDAHRIVILPNDRAVLLDAGLYSLSRGPQDLASVRTAPPEVWQGLRPDARSDTYALGVLLIFALTGRFPFDDANLLEICQQHLRKPPPSLASRGLDNAHPALDEVLARFLAKAASDRFTTGAIAATALARVRLQIRTLHAQGPLDDVPPPAGYRLLRKLGQGGFGQIFEAVHTTLEKIVAIKVAHPEKLERDGARERFLNEARLAASLDHPGVIQVFDVRDEHDRLYLIMEYVPGETVRVRVQREGSLEPPEACSIARQVLGALVVAHERGVVHRDLKPDNLLVDARGRVRVADFGLATSMAEDLPRPNAERVVGTPNFISPEQARGDVVDPRADLYSLGATLFYMLTGRPPFVGLTVQGTIRKHVEEAPPRLSDVMFHAPPELEDVISRLLAKSPAARYANASEVLDSLPHPGDLSALPPPELHLEDTTSISLPPDADGSVSQTQQVYPPLGGLGDSTEVSEVYKG